MTALALLTAVRAAGAELGVRNGRLLVSEYRGPLPADLVVALREHKSELLALLASEPPTAQASPVATPVQAPQPAPLVGGIAPGDWVVVAKPPELVCSKLGKPVELIYPPDCGSAGCIQRWACECPVNRPGYFVTDVPVIVERIRRPRLTEDWSVVSTGKAYPVAWLRRFDPNAAGGAV
jgi:TubC N-terminal docking domain